MLGKLVVGVQVYVSVAQALPMRFMLDEMQDDIFGEAPQGCSEVQGLGAQARLSCLAQGLSCQPADDLEVHRCVYHYPYMVRVVTLFLVGVIDSVHNDRQCLQFPVRGGPKDGSPCEVVLVQSACRVYFQP